jgi:transposase
MAKKKRSKYDDNFRREAVRLLETRGDRTAGEVAESIGVSESMLWRWKKKFGGSDKPTTNESGDADSAAELKELRKRIRELEMERDILKKATAFFAKESR